MGGGGVCFSDGGDLFLSGRGGYPMGGIGLYVGEGEFKKIVGYWGGEGWDPPPLCETLRSPLKVGSFSEPQKY